MRDKYILSVIICVYNGQKTIEHTLTSLLQQSFKDLEVIIVNDASLDNTENVVKQFFSKHPEIKYNYIKNNTNMGLCYSRFEGVLVSQARYVTFLDADDSISSDIYKTLINELQQTNSDIVICGVNRVRNDQVVATVLFNETDILQFQQNRIKVLLQKASYNSGFIWLYNKIIKRELFISIAAINNLYKNKVYINMGEDVLLSLYLYYYAGSITFVNQALYNYHINLNSMVNLRGKNINNIIKSIDSLSKVLKYSKLFLTKQKIFVTNKEYYNNYLQHEATTLTLKHITLTEVQKGLLDKYINTYYTAFNFYPSMNKLLTKMVKKNKLFKSLAIAFLFIFIIVIIIIEIIL